VPAAIPEEIDHLPSLCFGNRRRQCGVIRAFHIFQLRLRPSGESGSE